MIAAMDLGAIAAFVAAADGRSFTAAGKGLGITASGISKAISRLEDELHVRLFNRSTRSISLTADGESLYARCKQILSDLDDAKVAMLQAQSTPSGKLRVSMPAIFGRIRVIPAITAFMQRYPLVSIEADVSDRMVDVVEEGYDVVIRIGDLPDNRMVARPLTSTRFVVCGTPGYLSKYPVPNHPEDLKSHSCVQFISPQTHRIMDWMFLEEGRTFAHVPTGALSLDSGDAIVDAALCDAGLVYVQDYMAEAGFDAGTLVRVLASYACPPLPVVAMYPQNRHLSPKVRAFVDFMVEHFKALPAVRA
jgi:LysR family transcriptional regulator, regulator for bpeEF and oprC